MKLDPTLGVQAARTAVMKVDKTTVVPGVVVITKVQLSQAIVVVVVVGLEVVLAVVAVVVGVVGVVVVVVVVVVNVIVVVVVVVVVGTAVVVVRVAVTVVADNCDCHTNTGRASTMSIFQMDVLKPVGICPRLAVELATDGAVLALACEL